MTIAFLAKKSAESRPIFLVREGKVDALSLPPFATNWLKAQGFKAAAGKVLLLPDEKGYISGALLGVGDGKNPFLSGALARHLPQGDWHFEGETTLLTFLGAALGGYAFKIGKKPEKKKLSFFVPATINQDELQASVDSVTLVRDLINMPTNEMQPDHLEKAVRKVAKAFDAKVKTIIGDELLEKNFPLIHAVGRAGAVAPRLIDLHWGEKNAKKVTLVGKGVCFDTGGLDIKGASGMLLMKKDMGGAANVLGLARLIMAAKLPIRLRVLIPAVENAIAGNAFRPGDIIKSRKGLSVEIGNTDAEGRLILADALAYGDEDKPDLMIDMATLTGAARVALGPDLPPFYTKDDDLAQKIALCAANAHDPLWRMPLWQPYMDRLSSRIADINNVTSDGFAGSITAALFLNRFVEKAKKWAHFDIYGWTPSERPGFPVGGEAQGIRALYDLLKGDF